MSLSKDDLLRSYVRVGARSEFSDERATVCLVEGHEIAVWLVDGAWYAMSVVCPHQHVPLLGEGPLDGLVVTCPMHGWTYRIDTGQAVNASGRVPTFSVHADETGVYVERPPEPAEPMW